MTAFTCNGCGSVKRAAGFYVAPRGWFFVDSRLHDPDVHACSKKCIALVQWMRRGK